MTAVRIGELALRIVQRGAMGSPVLQVKAPGALDDEPADLDRDDVERLRDACDRFLDGRHL
jgi:hypothetical protein